MATYLLRTVVNPILPWERDPEETGRFHRILITLLVVSILLSAIIPFLEVEKPDRNRATSIPPRLVKMVLEQKKVVKPPPPPEEVKEEEPEPEKEEEKPKEEEKKPEEKPPEPKKTAKEVAKKHIAVFDALADLRDPDDMEDLKKNQSLSNDTGEAAQTTRALITKKGAASGSGGIRVATASQSVGTGSLAGQNTTNVESDIGDAIENTKRVTKTGTLKRSSENIALAFEKHKGAIFTLYQRALRKDPGLQGRVNFKLTILANGQVSKCSVESSELNNEALEKRLIARIKRINFGALDVAVWEGTYLINFFPNQ